MNRFIRWFNQNRKSIWVTVIVVLSIFVLIQLLDNYYKNKKENSNAEEKNYSIYTNPNYSIVTDEVVEENIANKTTNIICKFLDLCNEKDFENAYLLISNDCKQKMFPDVDSFKNYAEKIFKTKKVYKYQSWVSTNTRYTYRVELSEDMLATGKSDSNKTVDFYTIINENGEIKLNINNYVGSEEINKTGTGYGLTITAIKKEIYMDYEIYTFDIKNENARKIKLDSGEYLGTMYLQYLDKNKIYAERNEIEEQELEFSYTKDNLQIKFNNAYNPKIKMQKIVFEDIILNYLSYERMENKEEYNEWGRVEISL